MISLFFSGGEATEQNGSAEKRDAAEKPARPKKPDCVVVSAAALIGWDDYLTRSMQRQYRIIQALKEHRRRTAQKRRRRSRAPTSAAPRPQSSQAESSQDQSEEDQPEEDQQTQNLSLSPDSEGHGLMTIAEYREAVVRKRCEALRPNTSWEEVAESLGISGKTLWDDRRRIFDSSHKFHPDQSP